MSGTEFIVTAIICVLFGATCYWIGYGYGKEGQYKRGAKAQMAKDSATLDGYRTGLQTCMQDLAHAESAIDALRDTMPNPRALTAGQIIDLARHRGKEC